MVSIETLFLVIFSLNLDFETSKNYKKSHRQQKKLSYERNLKKKVSFLMLKNAFIFLQKHIIGIIATVLQFFHFTEGRDVLKKK